ncbi:MAG: methyltransferase domain-containing protein [Stigonema ocellatum SAG 48.90 = DSM 106950]|nr:methyltransferase domain-containing protein [Stigonema ocellatum SAG 48.90 = DSM 106950]
MIMSVSFDRVSDIYDATRGLPTSTSVAVTDTILNLTSATPDTKFFETGIGTGRIALPIVQRGYSYTGVDISEKMLAELQRKLEGISHRLTTVKADATSLPFADNFFDVALTVHVFHLISNWQQALAEIRRVLKSGGIYLYSHGSVYENSNQDKFDFEQKLQDIMADYDFPLPRYGAIEEEVLDILREQGATLETVVAARWQSELTVGKLLEHHQNKVSRHTWHLPDDIFARVIQNLRDWSLQRYGSLDYDLSGERIVKIVVVRNWA